MNLKALSDQELVSATDRIVAQEREITTQVIEHLREIERRRLYAKLGFPSLFQYCTEHLKYCAASAQLRIDAMRLSKEVPEVTEALESGAVSLSSVGVLQKHIRQEKVNSVEKKRELFKQIENKSKHEVEKTFAPTKPVVTIQITQEILDLMEQMKAKMMGNPSQAEVLEAALKKALGIKEARRTVASPGEVKTTRRPYIPVAVRREVLKESRCTYVSPITGKRCAETRILQLEHCKPFALGGDSSPENLTVLCREHNRLRAIETFGANKMRPYLRI